MFIIRYLPHKLFIKLFEIKNLEIKFNALQGNYSPNLNYILYRSAYKEYNWYNPNLKIKKYFIY